MSLEEPDIGKLKQISESFAISVEKLIEFLDCSIEGLNETIRFDQDVETDLSNVKKKFKPLVLQGDSTNLSIIPDESITLGLTSIPYNVGMKYRDDPTNDRKLPSKFVGMLYLMFKEVYKKIVPGGKIAINIANLERKPYLNLCALVSSLLQKAGFNLFGEIIWHKGQSGNGTAWGSFMSPSNPSLRDVHEYIVVARKGTQSIGKHLDRDQKDDKTTITKDGFTRSTMSYWQFSSSSSKKHPALFPIALPWRLINLFTFVGDRVLDFCVGLGTTLDAAHELGRLGIGIDISSTYVNHMNEKYEELGKKIMDEYPEYWIKWFEKLDENNLEFYF